MAAAAVADTNTAAAGGTFHFTALGTEGSFCFAIAATGVSVFLFTAPAGSFTMGSLKLSGGLWLPWGLP